ncbi:MAG: alpha/beta hydrolase [Kiritimatiellia bacterium]|jgi:acetyl esterase/lipase
MDHPTLPLWPGNPPGTVNPDEPGAGATETPCLKPFLLDGDALRPLVVVCPGGGYGWRAPHEADPVAQWLNGVGLHAAVCHYRVAPWRHPAPLDDARRALRLVRAHADEWHVDPGRVGILGFSAGGHLACSAANFGDDGDPAAADPVARFPSRPNALVGCYPVVTSGPKGNIGTFENLLGKDPDPALLAKLSLETTVTPANPPAFLWSTTNDTCVPPENVLLYATALSAAGVAYSLHVYPDAWHGTGLARDFPGTARRWTLDCEAWLREIGWSRT